MKRIRLLVLSFLLVLPTAYSNSGNSGAECGEAEIDKTIDQKKRSSHIQEMTGKLLVHLEQNVDKVALVSRAGSDFSERNMKAPSRMKYSHVGIVVKVKPYRWFFVHLLNDCAGPESKIYKQGLGMYLQDDPFLYDLKVTEPSLELQEKMFDLLTNQVNGETVIDEDMAKKYHNPKYSNVAYPFNTKYQNSNMWVLTIIAAAQGEVATREQAQLFYQAKGFVPSQVKPSWLERKFGTWFTKNFQKDDHPKRTKWFSFVSTDSVDSYLESNDELVETVELCLEKGCNLPVSSIDKI